MVPEHDWLSEFPPPRSLSLDQEALRIYERAYAIGLVTEKDRIDVDPPITFSALLLALLLSEDETSRWFSAAAGKNGPLLQGILAEKKVSLAALPSATTPGRPAVLHLSSDKQLLTLSSQGVLGTAEEWATRVGASDIGVRHLVASYVLNPPGAHRRQLAGWGYNEASWRESFFAWVATRYTAESWTDAKGRVTPTKAIPSFERPKVKGNALAFDGDPAAMRVLARAAAYHARRQDPWLRLQTVLFALIDEAREHPDVRRDLAPITAAALNGADKYSATLAVFRKDETAEAEGLPFDALDISPRVLNALETARELAAASPRPDNRPDVLALAGALISRRVDDDEDLAAMGFEPQALRRTLIAHAVARGETEETWQEALGEEEIPPTGRSMELNSDEPEAVVRADEKWASDPLGIRGDVESFATLLASKSLEPPLSIGLFGPWGAGKTTFLKRLRLAIDARTAQGRDDLAAGRPTLCVAEVVHIEFNAWHFAETALISSLVDTIVRALQAHIKNDAVPVGKALETLKSETAERLRRRQDAAAQLKTAADTAVTAAVKTLETKQQEAGQKAAGLQSALKAAWTAALDAAKNSAALKDSGVIDRFDETIQGAEDLKARIAAARARPARLLTDLGWQGTLIFAGIVLVLPVGIAGLVHHFLGSDGISQAVVTLSAALSVVGVWLKSASGAVAKVDAGLAKLADAYEAEIRGAPAVQKAQLELDAANSEAAAAASELGAAQSALEQAEAELAAAALPAQVLSLVSSRVEDRSYAQELTTISAARGDLQLLSRLLREQAAAGNSTPGGGVATVERVVLYIDDLDRCKPEDVVRVLQVVHMLLAFELFVVVVAVDARWVDESLKQTYHWLSRGKPEPGNGPAAEAMVENRPAETLITPQDYLEKIFQVSFWLEPMSAARAAEYLKSLVRTPRREYERAGGAVRTGMQLQAGRIEILPLELDYMRALAAYVGPSPRRVKRLVNAYRLLKARISDAQLEQFLTDRAAADGTPRSGPYQLVIGLLVIGTGAPGSAAEILAVLAQRDPRDRLDAIIAEFRARKHPDWTVAAQVLEMVMRTQKSDDISELRGWASKVGRFLLQGSANLPRPAPAETPQPEPVNA